MWFGIAETSGSRTSAELKAKHPPFDQNDFSIPISDSKTSTTFPGGAENPGNSKRHLLNSPGIPSPWDAHSKSFFFDKLVNRWLLFPSPLLSLGIPCAQSWNSDQEFWSQGFWGMEKLYPCAHHPLTHPDGTAHPWVYFIPANFAFFCLIPASPGIHSQTSQTVMPWWDLSPRSWDRPGKTWISAEDPRKEKEFLPTSAHLSSQEQRRCPRGNSGEEDPKFLIFSGDFEGILNN